MSNHIINENGVDRPMTDDEIANLETVRAENQSNAQAAAEREKVRQTALAKLGLTADEAAALFG